MRLVNDAVMQALGAYDDGGRMLFLGLGTGVGSALVTEHVIVPLELGSLALANGRTIADRLGREGLEVNGIQAWNKGAVMALPADVTNATGLAPWLARLGISSARTIGVGDAGNDQAFVRACGVAVAVANALPW